MIQFIPVAIIGVFTGAVILTMRKVIKRDAEEAKRTQLFRKEYNTLIRHEAKHKEAQEAQNRG